MAGERVYEINGGTDGRRKGQRNGRTDRSMVWVGELVDRW